MLSNSKVEIERYLENAIDALHIVSHRGNKSGNQSAIIWEQYPILKDWLHGEIILGNDGCQLQITNERLIQIFKFVLSSHRVDNIKMIWSNNQFLLKVIQGLTYRDAKDLLHNVMRSSTNGRSEFIFDYLDNVVDVKILNDVLSDIKKTIDPEKRESLYKYNQIRTLEARISALNQNNGQTETGIIDSPREIKQEPQEEKEIKVELQDALEAQEMLMQNPQLTLIRRHYNQLSAQAEASFFGEEENQFLLLPDSSISYLPSLTHLFAEAVIKEDLHVLTFLVTTSSELEGYVKGAGSKLYSTEQLDQLAYSFEFALKNKTDFLLDLMLQNNTLKLFVCGQLVLTLTGFYRLSLIKSTNFFLLALGVGNQNTVEIMWPYLQNFLIHNQTPLINLYEPCELSHQDQITILNAIVVYSTIYGNEFASHYINLVENLDVLVQARNATPEEDEYMPMIVALQRRIDLIRKKSTLMAEEEVTLEEGVVAPANTEQNPTYSEQAMSAYRQTLQRRIDDESQSEENLLASILSPQTHNF